MKLRILKYIFVLRSIVVIIFTIMSSSCENMDIHGTGDIIIETRFIEDFNSVDIKDNINVDFHFDSTGSNRIVIEGGEKLLPNIRTEVVDSVLYLENHNTWNWLRSFRKSKISVTVYTDQIKSIMYTGFGNISFSDTLHVHKFSFETYGGNGSIDLTIQSDTFSLFIHTGSPELVIKGFADKFSLYNNAQGIVEAFGLIGNDVVVHSSGTSDSYVSPVHSIGATLEYIGNVYYRNNPEILWKVENGSGRLIQVN